jgi:hypothetical protein
MADTHVKMTSIETDALIKMDAGTLKMLVLSSAAHIIHECGHWMPDPADNGKAGAPPDAATSVLAESTNWAQHGYVNALQTHVALVYEFQYGVMKGWLRNTFIGRDEADLIVNALVIYQTWKTRYVARDKKVPGHGPNWGDATPFTQADWSDNNEEFLAYWKSKE